MDSKVTRENREEFRCWEMKRRWLKRFFWAYLFIYILIFIVCPFALDLYRELVEIFTLTPADQVEIPYVENLWALPFVVIMGVVYAILLAWFRLGIIKNYIGQYSRRASIFAALTAAEELGKGNPVRASLFVDKLLTALSDFIGQKVMSFEEEHVSPQDDTTVKEGPILRRAWRRICKAFEMGFVAPGKFMHITPESIPRRAVRRTIQHSKPSHDFQDKLRELANGLSSNGAGKWSKRYLAVHNFLFWLNLETEPYHLESRSYFDKYPALRTAVLEVTPIVLPPIVALATAFIN